MKKFGSDSDPFLKSLAPCLHFFFSARAALAAVSSDRQFLEAKLQSHKGLTKESQAGLTGAEWDDDDDDEEEKGAAGGDRVLKSNIVGYPVSDDEDNSNVREVESLPNELLELKRQLTYLRNEFSQVRLLTLKCYLLLLKL